MVHVFASFAFAVSPARGFATHMCSCHGYVCGRDVALGWTPANTQLNLGAPGHRRTLPRRRAPLAEKHPPVLRTCRAHLGMVCLCLAQPQPPRLSKAMAECESRAVLWKKKVEPMPGLLLWTFHSGLSLSQTPCKGSSPRGLEGTCSGAAQCW